MFDARYIPEDGGPAKSLRAEDYDAAVHRHNVLCGDFNCQARLFYRNQSMRFGNVLYRMPHFVTFADSKHIDDCTHFNPSTEEKALRRIPEALAAGKNILVNINVDLGLPSVAGADPRDTGTAYGRFLAKSNHLAVSVKSASDLLRVRDTLVRAGGEAALARTYAGHQLELRRFENVFIGDEKEKLKTLFNALAQGEGAVMRGPQAQVTGFPRLFLFTPTKNTAEHGTRAKYINGTSQFLTRRGDKVVLLAQTLGMHDISVRQDILGGRPAYVLAVPVFNPAAAKPMRDGRIQERLSWRIVSESQYVAEAPAPKLI
jgi:hypothetical protein